MVRHGQPQRAVSNSSSALQGRTASAPPTATATATPTPTAIATATDTATAASTATEQHHDHEVANGGEPQRASSLPTGTNVLIKRNATALPDSISVEETYTTSRTYLDETEQTIAMEKTLSQPQQQQPSDGDHETQQKRQPGRHTPVSKKRQAADTPPSPDAKRSKPQKTEPKKTLSPKLKDDKRNFQSILSILFS